MHYQRQFTEDKLVIGTHNKGKLREICALFKNYEFEVLSAQSLGLEEPEETEKTFRDNALLKARAASQGSKLPALADDSGLVVPSLDGAPGIYSARWAGSDRNFTKAMNRVHQELAKSKSNEFSAHFVCALALAWPDGTEICVEGKIFGEIVWPPRGSLGFGYDPIFKPNGYSKTFGEFEPSTKHAVSHRAHAFKKLIKNSFAQHNAS